MNKKGLDKNRDKSTSQLTGPVPYQMVKGNILGKSPKERSPPAGGVG